MKNELIKLGEAISELLQSEDKPATYKVDYYADHSDPWSCNIVRITEAGDIDNFWSLLLCKETNNRGALGRVSFRGVRIPYKHLDVSYLSGINNTQITVNGQRLPEDILRDIKRRLFPDYEHDLEIMRKAIRQRMSYIQKLEEARKEVSKVFARFLHKECMGNDELSREIVTKGQVDKLYIEGDLEKGERRVSFHLSNVPLGNVPLILDLLDL